MNQKLAYLFFILLLPFIGLSQTRYKSIEVTGVNEYGYQINNLREICFLRGFLKITNITDSVIIVLRNKYGNVQYLGGDNSTAAILPGYSYLFPIGTEPTHKMQVLIYKMDTVAYARGIDQRISLDSDILDIFEKEEISLDNINLTSLIRSIDPESDTTVLKSNCNETYKSLSKWKAAPIVDTSKIKIGGISEFGFYIQKITKSVDAPPFEIKVRNTYYNNSANANTINGMLTVTNVSIDTIYIEKIIFDTPKGTTYVYKNVKHNKDGALITKGKKTSKIFNTSGIIDTYVNMDHYYVPPRCSAAYYFWYTCLYKDKNMSQEDFLKMYDKLPGHVYFSNGTTMSFTLEFDKKYLIQRINQIVWK